MFSCFQIFFSTVLKLNFKKLLESSIYVGPKIYSVVRPSFQSVLPFKGIVGDFFFIALYGRGLDWFISRKYFLLKVKAKVHLSLPPTLFFFSSSQVSLLQLIGYAARNLQCLLRLS